MLEQAVKMEMNSVDDYNKWANECAANADSVSKKIIRDTDCRRRSSSGSV